MSEQRDRVLLASLDQMILDAPAVGICPLAFKILKKEVQRIMSERDRALKQ